MVAMPYVHDAKHATRVLDLVRNATTPGKATAKHLEANGFPEPAATQVWTFLHGLGLVEQDGHPTDRWIAYRDAQEPADVLSALVRDVYAPLAQRAETLPVSDADLAGLVDLDDSADPAQADLVVSTFRALCERAGITLDAAAAVPCRPRREVLHDVSELLQRSVNEFEQARQCLAIDLTRPAHVAAWNSFVALAFAHLADDDFARLRTGRRATWTLEELMRAVHGAELIRLLVKNELVPADDQQVLEELLRQRNECAHPMPFTPDRAETAAYLSAVLSQSAQLTGSAPAEPTPPASDVRP